MVPTTHTSSHEPQTLLGCQDLREACRSGWRSWSLWILGTILSLSVLSVGYAFHMAERNTIQDGRLGALEKTAARTEAQFEQIISQLHKMQK